MNYCDLNLKCINIDQYQEDYDYIKLIVSCLKDQIYNIALNYEVKDLTKPFQPSKFQPVDLEKIKKYIEKDISLSQYQIKLDELKQFSRLTLVINETKFLTVLSETNKNLQSYDIIAVKTNNEKVFNELCINYECFDIISSDISDGNYFLMKRGHVQEAIKRGLYFEMQYSPLFYQSDKKRIILQNMMKIVKATKGKNLVITSESQNFLQHRSPQDMVSLFKVLELNNDDTFKATKENQLMCIQRSKYRKNFKGVISLVSEKDKEYFKIKEQENQIRINNKIQKKLKMQQNDQSQHSKDELLKKFKNRQEIIKKETQQQQKQIKNQDSQNYKKRKQNQVEAEKLEKKQKKQQEKDDNNTQTNVKEEIVQKQLIEINSGIDFCIDVNPEN